MGGGGGVGVGGVGRCVNVEAAMRRCGDAAIASCERRWAAEHVAMALRRVHFSSPRRRPLPRAVIGRVFGAEPLRKLIGYKFRRSLNESEHWVLIGAYNMFHMSAVHAALFPAPLAAPA